MGRILVVDDDHENSELITHYLEGEGHTFQFADDGESALHRVRAWKPQAILLDVNLKEESGLDLIPRIRSAMSDDYASIILISGGMTVEDVTRGLDAGADDYLTKPFRAQDLISRLRVMLRLKETHDSLRRVTHRAEELASRDPLTGILNLLSFFRKGEETIQRTHALRRPISLIALNLDGFSSVNESGGFALGNQILSETARRIESQTRSIDLIGRMGGDEFLVLLPDTDLAAAEEQAARIHAAIGSRSFRGERQGAQVTVSLGVGTLSPEAEDASMSELMRMAKEALRSAKSAGRDRVEVYAFG